MAFTPRSYAVDPVSRGGQHNPGRMRNTGERVVVEHYRSTAEQYLIYLFHVASYRFAAPYAKGREVLDYGCGSGYGCAEIAAEAARVVGVNVSPQAIKHAKGNFSAPNLEFAPTEADQPLSFPDRSFDTVLSFQVIEHVGEIELRRTRRAKWMMLPATV